VKISVLLLGVASLVPSAASAEMLAVKTQSASFRAQPSDKSPVVYSADKFYPVEVVERKNGWVKAKDFEGDTAWVAEKSLGKLDTVVIDTPTANIRQKAATDAEVLFKVAHGEVFKVEDHHDNWLKVKDAHGDGGWIRVDKTWGLEGENTKGKLEKGPKADVDPAEKADEGAKSAHDDKKHPEKKADANKPAAPAPESTEFVCKPMPKSEPTVAHADLTKPANEKAVHEKPVEKKPDAHVKKSERPAHAKNGHVKKSPRAQKKQVAQVRRKKK